MEDELCLEGERWIAGGEDREVRTPGDLSSSTELPLSEIIIGVQLQTVNKQLTLCKQTESVSEVWKKSAVCLHF